WRSCSPSTSISVQVTCGPDPAARNPAINPPGRTGEQFTPAHGHFDRLKRHRTRVSSVCHINEMKQQRQTRHQAAVFGEVLHNDRMLFLPQFAVLQRAPPLEEPLLSCILESEVRRFGAFFDKSAALEKVHVGQPPDNVKGALSSNEVRTPIHEFPAARFVGIDQQRRVKLGRLGDSIKHGLLRKKKHFAPGKLPLHTWSPRDLLLQSLLWTPC